MNQAALLQVWCQPLNSPTIDSTTLDSRVDDHLAGSTVQSALQQAALQLQSHLVHEEGSLYRLEDLQQVLVRWLESSIDCLVEDALFHTLEGDRAFAFNRHAFEKQMQHLQPLDPDDTAAASSEADSQTVASTIAA